MAFANTQDNSVYFTNGYTDHAGNKKIIDNKRKINKKYYVYTDSHNSNRLMDLENKYNPLEVIEYYRIENHVVIFYKDRRNVISFIVSDVVDDSLIQQVVYDLEMRYHYLTKIKIDNDAVVVYGVLWIEDYNFKDIYISLGYNHEIKVPIEFKFDENTRSKKSNNSKYKLYKHAFKAIVPMQKLYDVYMDNSENNIPVYLQIEHQSGIVTTHNLKRRKRDKYDKNHFKYVTNSKKCVDDNLEIFARKSVYGQYVLVMTSHLDKQVYRNDLKGSILAKIPFKNRHNIIFFEKFCEGADESAFKTFEQLSKTNNRVYYILDENHHEFEKLKQRFGDQLLAKNSVEAFEKIYSAEVFVSSDLISHIQRRLYDNSKRIRKKILKNHKKIFLQHGVSLATDLFARGYYNKKVPIAPDYICVSSEMEKQHFLKNSQYNDHEIIKTGLANMDDYVNNYNNPKDEITFMLTWRPWDIVGAEDNDYLKRYFEFIDKINNEDFYKNKKINVILHPKANNILKKQMPEFYNGMKKYFYTGPIKDVMMRSKVLITDYSSISFYAFAGGTNVIFYWEDKALAESKYGAPNILQEDNCFGDVCYNMSDLTAIIKDNYSQKQANQYIDKYSIMVETNDGNCAKRVSELLEKLK